MGKTVRYVQPWDDGADERSAATAKRYDPREDMTRQELRDSTDLNLLLRKYLPGEIPSREVFYGERDYDQDFHEAMIAQTNAREWWERNEAIRAKFASFEAFLNATPEEVGAAFAPASSGVPPKAEEGSGGTSPGETAPEPSKAP